MKKIYQTLFVALLSLPFSLQAQLPWRADSSFNADGIFQRDYGFQDNLTAVVEQPADQKILAVGTAISQTTFGGRLLILRLLPDGTLDNTFNDSGSVVITDYTESYAYAVEVLADGKILVAGATANEQYQFSAALFRFNSNGSLDNTFGTNGVYRTDFTFGDEFAYDMAIQPDGKIVLAGSAGDEQFRPMPALWRVNPDGTADLGFGNNGMVVRPVLNLDNDFSNVLILSDGKIAASGHFDQGLTSGGLQNFDILAARFLPNGTPDSTFADDGYAETPVSSQLSEEAYGMVVGLDGNLVVAGYTLAQDQTFNIALVKYKNNGTLEGSFGVNGIVRYDLSSSDVANDLILHEGKLLCAGTTLNDLGDLDFTLVRFNDDGSIDNTFSDDGVLQTNIAGGFDDANGITLQADGKIVVAGKGSNGLQNDAVVVRYTNILDDTGIEMPSLLNGVVYPNPIAAGTTAWLKGLDSASGEVRIIDLMGRVAAIPQTQGAMVEIPASLAPGMYWLSVSGANGRSSAVKLIVK